MENRPRLNGLVLRLVALHFIVITGFSAFEATFALLGNRRLGMSESAVAVTFAAVGVLLALTQGVVVGRAAVRFGELGNVRMGLALTTVGYLLLAAAGTWPLLIAALGLLTFGQGLIIPSLASAIAGADPGDTSGLAFGWQQSAGGLARVIGPLMGGALFALTTGLPYIVAAALTGIALAVLAAAQPKVGIAVDD